MQQFGQHLDFVKMEDVKILKRMMAEFTDFVKVTHTKYVASGVDLNVIR